MWIASFAAPTQQEWADACEASGQRVPAMKKTAIDDRGLGDLALFAAFVLTLFAVLAVTQSNFAPDPTATTAFMARAQIQVSRNFKVTAAAPSPQESALFFGEPLADPASSLSGLKWRIVRMGRRVCCRPQPIPPIFHRSKWPTAFTEIFAATANAARDQFFNAEQIASIVAARSAVSGFVFTNLDRGLKFKGSSDRS
jgi:hypothetical protein